MFRRMSGLSPVAKAFGEGWLMVWTAVCGTRALLRSIG
jgi:hypothetical protein